MALFISHSHTDAAFVDRLAVALVKAHAHVWVDRWELKVGDSLIQRIQDAITSAGALLVVLSKASVGSEWCRKELSAGLIRELEEKQVLVLPLLLEDCEVPLFLRDKLYADFRASFDEGLSKVLGSVARVAGADRARFTSNDDVTDWAMDYGAIEDVPVLQFTFVQQPKGAAHTALTEVRAYPNPIAAARIAEYTDANLEWFGHHIVAAFIAEAAGDLRVLLTDSSPASREFAVRDARIDYEIACVATCRILGGDPGHDVLINVSGLLQQAVEHMKNKSRSLTPAELRAVARIQGHQPGT